MSDIRQARSILEMAMKDLKALKGMRDKEVFDDEIFGFHAQQSVEKSLKAWIAFLGTEYPYTHDISVLLHSLIEAGVDVEDYWDLVEYNAFAVQFRYQSIGDADEQVNREASIERVEDLLQHVRNLIES